MQKWILIVAAGALAFLIQGSEPPPRAKRSSAPREHAPVTEAAPAAAAPVDESAPLLLRVRGSNGKPLAGARVNFFERQEQRVLLASFVTDARGLLRARLEGAGLAVVTAPRHAAGLVILQERRCYTVRLEPGFTVAGVVTDSCGRPLDGTQVVLSEQEGCTIRSEYNPKTRTDREGRFRFDGATNGWCQLHAHHDGFSRFSGFARSGDEAVRIKLTRPAGVSGLVVDRSGIPVAGAVVRGIGRRLRTDAAGWFHADDVRPGPVSVSARHTGWQGEVSLDVSETSETHVRIVLDTETRRRTLVRLLDAHDRPIAQRALLLDHESANTNEEGRATILSHHRAGERETLFAEGLPGGRWEIEVGQPGEIVLRPSPVVPVRFEVRDTGGALLRVPVAIGGATDDGGLFLLAPELTYHLRVQALGFHHLSLDDWRPPERGGVVALTLLRTATITGRLDGKYAVYTDLVYEEEGENCEGRFCLEVAPGARHVLFGEPVRLMRRITVAEGAAIDLGRIKLPPLVRIRGTVRDRFGDPVGGAAIQLIWPEAIWAEDTSSHADGTFEIDVPKGAPVMLKVHKAGVCTAVVEPKQDVEIRLGATGTLRVEQDFVELGWRRPAGGSVWAAFEEHELEHLAQGELAVRMDGKTIWTYVRAGEVTVVGR